MVKKQVQRRQTSRGSVTVELVALIVLIAMPILMAVSELARFDHTARALQFSLQAKCIAKASAEMRESNRHVVIAEGDASFRTRFPPYRHHIFKRRYVIVTGTNCDD